MRYDLVVVGASSAGLSVAAEARRAGVDSVTVIAVDASGLDELALRHRVHIHRTAGVEHISRAHDGTVTLRMTDGELSSSTVAVDVTGRGKASPPWSIPAGLEDRVHSDTGFDAEDQDVLVVGGGDAAVSSAWALVATGARVVVSHPGPTTQTSLVGRQMLEEMERQQQATVLWHSVPDELVDIGGFPMAFFSDKRTPDLQFDHVVVGTSGADKPDFHVDEDVAGDVYLVGSKSSTWPGPVVSGAEAWSEIRADRFPKLAATKPQSVKSGGGDRSRVLAKQHYNATITYFDTAHNELWRLRVRPDHAGIVHRPGQYCSLGIGYWEPRADDRTDHGNEKEQEKLVRRSYSISSPIFDDNGYLADHVAANEIELYIVWVQPTEDRIPELTPRLALKHAGDRVYVGPKVAGRYTLAPVTDPSAPVLFCATGTGEAPHNAMIVELLRKGHHGPILSAVSVRYWSDLAYLSEHERLSERYPNYRYLAFPTREPDIPKRYMQDLLRQGDLENELGVPLDPETSHVFLCGNPEMIGLPDWEEPDSPEFSGSVGVAELLHMRGFRLDRRGVVGNVHYEEYW